MKKRLFCALVTLTITLSIYGVRYFYDSKDSEQVGQNDDDSKPTNPDLAAQWRRRAWQDENGNIPPNAIAQAMADRDTFLAGLAGQDGLNYGGIAQFNWVPRGPQDIGGRTRALVIHPTQPSIMWAGSVSGGVWKSVDGGLNWFAQNGGLSNFAISSMAINPQNPDILYAGTGEGFANNDALSGGGIFRSTDGGMTWSALLATIPNPSNPDPWSRVDRISVASDGVTILAAARGGIFRSTDGGTTTWTQPYTAYTSYDVAFDPMDSNKAVAQVLTSTGVNRVIYSSNGGASWSNAQRGGSDFTIPNGFLGRIELVYAHVASPDPNVVYVSFNVECSSNPIEAGISRSSDGGMHFTDRAASMIHPRVCPSPGRTPLPNEDTPLTTDWYKNVLWVSPTDPNFIVAGGYTLFRSLDGGNSLEQISFEQGLGQEWPHADEHCIVTAPDYANTADHRRVYVCNDGGIFRTDDILTANKSPTGHGWVSLNRTYQTTQFYGAAGYGSPGHTLTGLINGGAQDNGEIRIQPSDQTGLWWLSGDGGFGAIDPNDPTFVYGENIFLDLRRLDPYGPIIGPTPPNSDSLLDAYTRNANFVAPFILDNNDSTGNKMLAGGHSLWRSSNVKSTSPTWSTIRAGETDTTNHISAIAIAPGHSDVIWFAEDNGSSDFRVYKTADGASVKPAWIRVDNNGSMPLPNRYVTRLLIDKDDPLKVFIGFGGFQEHCFWATTDGGNSWAPRGARETGLPRVPIRGIAQHPIDGNKLYVGTEIGIFVTEDGGYNWSVVMDGPVNVSVDEITFMSGSTKLLAATHGRGTWIADVDSPANGNRTLNDFDGDGRSDIAVVRHAPSPPPSASPSPDTWYLRKSTSGFSAQPWGLPADLLAAEDYDGDGKTDIAVFRPSNGTWYWLNSSDQTSHYLIFGVSGDIPVPADFDGDGDAEQAYFRPSTGDWHVHYSSGDLTYHWGRDGDTPVAADFSGDGIADFGVFRLKEGIWYLSYFGGEGTRTIQFGLNGDIPTVGDYDADGRADIAVWRPSDHFWYFTYSSTEWTDCCHGFQYGLADDIPVPGDYDGDGITDIGVFRPSDGNWYVRQSTNGYMRVHFGTNGDRPVSGKTESGFESPVQGPFKPVSPDARPRRGAQ
jgi:photosystem II stability/assembly factor-like uncharacterized protein